MTNLEQQVAVAVGEHTNGQSYKTFAETGEMHPAVLEVLQYFTFAHLPEHLQPISRTLAMTAFRLAATLPQCPELTRGLHALLLAKDAFVRAALNLDDVGRMTVSEVLGELTEALEHFDRADRAATQTIETANPAQ